MAFKVLDSTNKEVGKFISIADAEFGIAMVQLRINNKFYALPVYSDRIGITEVGTVDNVTIYYDDSYCAGQPFIDHIQGDSTFPLWRLTAMGWVTYNPDNQEPQTPILKSTNNTNNTGCDDFSGEPIDDRVVVKLAIGPDFRAGFTPPFRFE